MKKLMLIPLLLTASIASANVQVNYSSEEFCNLSQKLNKSIMKKNYLKAYAKKLGHTPSNNQCQSIRSERFAFQESSYKPWNYQFNRPSQGSVIRLSKDAVSRLKENQVSAIEFFKIY